MDVDKIRAIAVIKASVKETYDDTEEGATLFALGLVEKLAEEKLL